MVIFFFWKFQKKKKIPLETRVNSFLSSWCVIFFLKKNFLLFPPPPGNLMVRPLRQWFWWLIPKSITKGRGTGQDLDSALQLAPKWTVNFNASGLCTVESPVPELSPPAGVSKSHLSTGKQSAHSLHFQKSVHLRF